MTIGSDAAGDVASMVMELGESCALTTTEGGTTYDPATGQTVPVTSTSTLMVLLLDYKTTAPGGGAMRRVRRAVASHVREIEKGDTITESSGRSWQISEATALRVQGVTVAWDMLVEG